MSRVALDLGFIQIYYYTIFVFLGMLLGCLVIYKEIKKEGMDSDVFVNIVFYSLLFGLLGARIYYVLFNLSYYLNNPIEIFEIWNGGLAIHGGLLFGLLVLLFYTKKYHIHTLKFFDIVVVGLILGQAIGRWGNFFNQEAYGGITSLKALSHLPKFIVDRMYIDGYYRQPTFFYESCWDFLGFFVLLFIKRKKYLKVGELTGSYLVWYAFGRFFIEGMRSDSLMLGPIKIAQVVCIVMIIIGIYFLFFKRRKDPKLGSLYQKEKLIKEK